MSKITVDSFLATVRKSELVESAKLKTCLDTMRDEGVDFGSSTALASGLVEKGVLTDWQVQNLLKGKHRGYTLGKYRLLSLLGRGGMSAVYLAEHTLMRRQCAIKVLPTKRVGESSYLGRFHREAQAVASLDHPNIVRAYDVDHAVDKGKEIHFLVMEYVEGRDLQQIVDQDGPLDFREAVEYFRQGAEGFAHAHVSGLVHRDVKPANLLVDQNGVVKILDLGLARFFDEKDEKSLTVANDEKVLGTADYLAPEQAMDSHTADHRADVYGLGCSMYFTLCGHPPFNEGTLTQRLMAHQTKEPKPIEQEREDTPETLVPILRKMMAKKPDDRYQTMEEVSHALRDWLLANADKEWLEQHSNIVVATRGGDSNVLNGSGRIERPAAETPPPETKQEPQPAPPAKEPEEAAPAPEPAAAPVVVAEAPTPVVEPAPAAEPAEDELSSFLVNLGGATEETAPVISAESKTETTAEAPEFAIDTSEKKSPPEPEPVEPSEPTVAEPVAEAAVDDGLGIGDEPEWNTGGAVVFPVEESEPATAETAEAAPADVVEAEPEEAGAFVTAEPDPSPVRRASARRSKGGGGFLSSPAARIGLAAGGGLLTVLIAISAFQALSGNTGGGANGNGNEVDLDTREIVVGPDGQFGTLFEAVEHLSRLPRSNKAEPWTIEVAGGTTQTDAVFIDGGAFPANVTIKSSGGEPAVLAGSDGVPALEIIGADHLVLDGLVFDADGNDVALQVTGQVEGVEVRNSTFRNYKTGGLVGAGCYVLSGDPFTVSNCEFAGAKPTAAGVRVQKNFSTPAKLVFRGNRFTGRQRVGFALDGESQNIVIAENVFDGPSTGIEVTDKGLQFDGLTIVNNTFHATKNGVLFRKMPTGKGGLLARNLFVSKEGVEVAVTAGKDDRKFTQKVSARENWSLRGKPDKPPKTFVSVIQSWGDEKELQSTKPGEKGFLKPKPDGPLTKVKDDKEHERKRIGALAP